MNQNSGTSEAHEKAGALELRPFTYKNLIAHGADQVFYVHFLRFFNFDQ